jgi:transposase
MAWCEKELGVKVSYKKLYDWFRRWGYRKKVPQPMAEKADVQAQEGWKKVGSHTLCNQKPSEWRA